MKTVTILLMILVGYPAAMAGYFYGLVVAGFRAGAVLYDEHEHAILKREPRFPRIG